MDAAAAPLEPGTLLVAGVMLTDGVFDGSVVLLLDVDASGALGVVLNRFADLELAHALPGWERLASYPHRLHDGGPVSQEGAICLASPLHADEEPPGWRTCWYSRSSKLARSRLKPVVLVLARLLDTTDMRVCCASSPVFATHSAWFIAWSLVRAHVAPSGWEMQSVCQRRP